MQGTIYKYGGNDKYLDNFRKPERFEQFLDDIFG